MAKLGTDKRFGTRFGTMCAAIALAGVLQVTGIPGMSELGLSVVQEAEAQRAKREKPKTRASQSLADSTAKEMLKAQEAYEAGNTAEAIAILNRLLQRELKPFDRASVNQFLGQLYAGEDDYGRAIAAFERAERLNALEGQQQLDLKFYLGQLYLAEDRVDDAIRMLEAWFAANDPETPPPPQAYFTLASAYATKENYSRALTLAEQGLQRSREVNDIRERWFAFTANMYYQNRDVRSMQGLLREMVGLFPGKATYWNQLSSTYAILEDETTAYHLRVMMDVQGMLSKSNEYNTLAQLHVFNEVPIRGAKLMERGFANGLVEKESKTYETLAMSYQEAREWKEAIPPLTDAARLSDDGELYIRLCQSYLLERQYSQAERACLNGINKGGLKDAGTAYMLLGTSRYSQDKLSTARSAFQSASRYERSRENARRWVRFLDQEIERAEARAADGT